MPEDAGALLVRSGLIASEQLRIARQAQAGRGGTIGEHLVLEGFIEDEALAEFYRARLMVPQVESAQLGSIPDWLIAKLPREMAAEFRCVPVACDEDRHLTLAMADPSTTHAVDEISFFTGHYVMRAVATQRQIAWCLARYYGTLTPLAEKMMAADRTILGPDDLPRFPMQAPTRPGHSGAVRVRADSDADTGEHVTGRHQVPRRAAVESDRLPLPAPGEDEVAADADPGSPVPVIIENDRPSPHPPYIPPETREPMISFLHEETAPTGPMRTLERAATPPELYDRAGELEVHTGPTPRVHDSLPAVVISPLLQEEPAPQSGAEHAAPGSVVRAMETGDTPGVTGEEREEMAGDPFNPLDPVDHEGARQSAAPRERELADLPPGPDPDQVSGEPGDAHAGDEPRSEDMVLLDRPKGGKRQHRRTRLGLGIAPSTLSRLTGGVPDRALESDRGQPEHAAGRAVPTEAPEESTRRLSAAVPYPAQWPGPAATADSIQTAARAAAEALAGARAQDEHGQAVPDLVQEPADAPGPAVAQEVSQDVSGASAPAHTRGSARSGARTGATPVPAYQGEELDDPRWGPPGSTIPPQYLGPQEVVDSGPSPVPLISEHLGDEFDDDDIDRVLNDGFELATAGEDIQIDESGPIRVDRARTTPGVGVASPGPGARSLAPTPAEVPASTMTAPPVHGPVLSYREPTPITPDTVQALEDSSLRLVEALRTLDQADERNTVVDTLIHHLAVSYQRVAFFVVKSGELTTWKQRIAGGPTERRDGIKLSLDEPSTFQDIVGTRLPFRGPLTDPVSRAFVAAALGYSAGQMLALPVSVRGRVVGVLYGDTETQSVFEQHLAVVTRAAGVALERILRARKGL